MESYSENEQETPKLAPENVRFEDFHIEPWPDGFRLRIHLQITPFSQFPDIETVITDPLGNEVSRTSIIEMNENRLVFTMHIRSRQLAGPFTITSAIIYPELGAVDQRQVTYDPILPMPDHPSDLTT
jgi:hypothetical protein